MICGRSFSATGCIPRILKSIALGDGLIHIPNYDRNHLDIYNSAYHEYGFGRDKTVNLISGGPVDVIKQTISGLTVDKDADIYSLRTVESEQEL